MPWIHVLLADYISGQSREAISEVISKVISEVISDVISEVISGQSRVSHLIRPADRRVAIRILRLHTYLHRSINRRRLIIHRVDADLGRRPWVEVEEERRGWRVLYGDAGWRGFYVERRGRRRRLAHRPHLLL